MHDWRSLSHVRWECKYHVDHAPERTWRHLDTMQFETRVVAWTPRADCKACGVKTIAVAKRRKAKVLGGSEGQLVIGRSAYFKRWGTSQAPEAEDCSMRAGRNVRTSRSTWRSIWAIHAAHYHQEPWRGNH